MYKRLNGMPLGWFEETHATQEDYEDISIGAQIGGGGQPPPTLEMNGWDLTSALPLLNFRGHSL